MCYVYLNMLTSRRLFGSQQTVGCTRLGEDAIAERNLFRFHPSAQNKIYTTGSSLS